MKIGIYTDVHCAYTSSILPLHCGDSKYTTRLKMIIDTFQWMYALFHEHRVDMIVNCGDLFDSHSLRSEEIAAMSEALSYSTGIPEFHVLGNHEILDKNRNFYATALLSNYSHIEVIQTPTKYDNLSFLPYMSAEDVEEVLPMLKNQILFSHIDIQGSMVTPQHMLESGVDPIQLLDLFDFVINGHLHSPQSFGDYIHNIGASTSLSFADNSEYTPSVTILDTEGMTFERFENPHAIRFIKMNVEDQAEFERHMKNVHNPVALRVTVPYDKKTDAETWVSQHWSDNPNDLVACRIMSDGVGYTPTMTSEELDLSSMQSMDVVDKFKQFLHTQPLKYPIESYISEIEEFSGGAQ